MSGKLEPRTVRTPRRLRFVLRLVPLLAALGLGYLLGVSAGRPGGPGTWLAHEQAPPHASEAAQEAAAEDEAPARVARWEGVPAVRLAPETQAQSGIATEVAQGGAHQPHFMTFGQVRDLQPLLELRARYNAALSQMRIAAAALEASQAEYQRLRRLTGVSAKALERATAAWKADQARHEGARAEVRDIYDQARQRFGGTLADGALKENAPWFERLLAQEEVLLLIALPLDRPLPAGVRSVWVGRNGERLQQAHLISPAPTTGTTTPGETYYFHTQGGWLRSGMQVEAWVAEAGAALSGVMVPETAVVWYAGQPWVYVQMDAEHFVRRAITAPQHSPAGLFVQEGLSPGERLVTRGAQMLLSEEFRWQIHEEEED